MRNQIGPKTEQDRIMRRLIILVGLLSIAAYGYKNISPSGPSVTVAAGAIVRDTGQLEAHFQRRGALSGAYMIFGGNIDRKLPNSFSDITLAALSIDDASHIHSRYPDFHKCKSAGASMAQRKTRTLSLVTGSEEAFDALEESLELHSERLQGNGDRTCVALEGNEISLSSVTLKETGSDISADVVPTFRNTRFFLVEDAQLADCRTLL